jgi:hypothetical protein
MVLDTKKGLLKADKEKGQYMNSEKGNSKEKRKKKFFFTFFLLRNSGQKILGLSGARGQTASALWRPERRQVPACPAPGRGWHRPTPDDLRPGATGRAGFVFFHLTLQLAFRSDLPAISCEEPMCTAVGSGRKEIKQGSNEDEIRNEDTEKNEGPRLLQI